MIKQVVYPFDIQPDPTDLFNCPVHSHCCSCSDQQAVMYGSLRLQDHAHIKSRICRGIKFPSPSAPACCLASGNYKCAMSCFSHHRFFLGCLICGLQFVINVYPHIRIIQKQADSFLRQTVCILRKHISFIRTCLNMISFFPE